MTKKQIPEEHNQNNSLKATAHSSFSQLVDCFDAEDLAQQEEFLKREKVKREGASKQSQHKQPKNSRKPKGMSFEEKLELTYQWLEDTFPHLFAADDYVPLDTFILGDLKNDYKNNHLKKIYFEDLAIKAALCRYKESYDYLESLKEGASRYNIKGEPCGLVTREEEIAAKKILITL